MTIKAIAPEQTQGHLRAERIRLLREKVLRLSREKFAKLYGVSKGSLQSWEDVRYGGLTEKGATALAQAFKSAGITDCTESWLLYGTGTQPQLASHLDKIFALSPHTEKLKMNEELQRFYQTYHNIIDARVQDDALAPFLSPGDIVAGEKLFKEDFDKALGKICIVQTLTGELLLGLLSEDASLQGHYAIRAFNPHFPSYQNLLLFSAAPILWIRKPRLR